MHTRKGVLALGLFLAILTLLSVADAASAQEVATSFEQLRVLVKPGDSVTVTHADGRQVEGPIRSLSSSSLELIADDTPRSFAEAEVRAVSQQHRASPRTGAKWGFFIGAGFGALAGVGAAARGYSAGESVGWAVGGAALYGGLGAGIGVGVASLIRSPRVIYAGRSPSSARLSVSPVLLSNRTGVAVSLGF
jgi:hypothetical protein